MIPGIKTLAGAQLGRVSNKILAAHMGWTMAFMPVPIR